MRCEYDPPITYRERLILAAVCIALSLVVATCGSCVKGVVLATPAHRTAKGQMKNAVKIALVCEDDFTPGGSGSIVRGGRVLTALHVVQACDDHKGIKTISVSPDNTHSFAVARDIEYPGMDVAFLVAEESALAPWYDPVSVGPLPELGAKACEAAGEPRWTYRCGDVEFSDSRRIVMSMFTEFGNSGAAVYDQDGRMIGITDSTMTCQGFFQCIDGVVPIQSLAWYIEE